MRGWRRPKIGSGAFTAYSLPPTAYFQHGDPRTRCAPRLGAAEGAAVPGAGADAVRRSRDATRAVRLYTAPYSRDAALRARREHVLPVSPPRRVARSTASRHPAHLR